MCDMCGGYVDRRPTLQEIAAEEWQEAEEKVVCQNCGEQRRFCTCTPPDEWEELDEC